MENQVSFHENNDVKYESTKRYLISAYKRSIIDPLEFVPNVDLLSLNEAPHQWNINSVRLTSDGASISGWCLPLNGRLGETELVINGKAYALEAEDYCDVYASLYPWHPNSAYSSFELKIPLAVQNLSNATEISVEPRSKLTGKTSPYSLEVLVADLDFKMPPAEIAARIGATNLVDYTIQGRSIYRALERALKSSFNSSFANYPQILDWGCGSGRVGRHTVAGLANSQTFVGFDIDAYAVKWANAKFGNHFSICATSPPLDLSSGSIDLAYAYSVFTHLAEADMRNWISELSRVIRPGGILLFSVLSDGAMVALYPVTDRALLTEWSKRGIYDSVANSQLNTIEVAKDYYRNVWLKKAFIEEELALTFELVDFVQGFHFYQDLVVAKRR
jgi:SAM-dependent methyltransferase